MNHEQQLTFYKNIVLLLDEINDIVLTYKEEEKPLNDLLPPTERLHFLEHYHEFVKHIVPLRQGTEEWTLEKARYLQQIWGCQYAYLLVHGILEQLFEEDVLTLIHIKNLMNVANELLGVLFESDPSLKEGVDLHETTSDHLVQ